MMYFGPVLPNKSLNLNLKFYPRLANANEFSSVLNEFRLKGSFKRSVSTYTFCSN